MPFSWTQKEERVFDVVVEDSLIDDIDIILRSGSANRALVLDKPVIVSDGFITIQGMANVPRTDNPTISAIEILVIGPHYSHAVTNGPYIAVDSDGDGFATVPVDGSESHTHGPGQRLVSYVWKKGVTVIGNSVRTTLLLPIGDHEITLTVTDSSGDSNTDLTIITVLPESFPEISSISPNKGPTSGGTIITIKGTGFNSITAVRFGETFLVDDDVTVVDSTTVRIVSPISATSTPVSVSVLNAAGESNTKLFTYLSTIPVQFTESKLFDLEAPTSISFGPDSKLYVGTYRGKLGKFTLNDSFDKILSSVITTIEEDRGIFGIAFDPLDNANTNNPTVYITTSNIYHDAPQNSFGDAINGNVLAVSGANLDVINVIVSGLPVSSADHGVSFVCTLPTFKKTMNS
jgi:hypothetical protein